jgi:hypothetical protein
VPDGREEPSDVAGVEAGGGVAVVGDDARRGGQDVVFADRAGQFAVVEGGDRGVLYAHD